jgi:DNA-binding response OmpR family regulator
MKTNLLIFGTKNFNNSFDEIKEDLGFTATYFVPNMLNDNSISSSAILIDSELCANDTILSVIKNISDKPILLLSNKNLPEKCKYNDKIVLPTNLLELKNKIINLITAYEFNKNSSIIVKNYTLDKNEKKLKKDNLFITIKEREVQLIELLYNEKNPLSKNSILKKVWKYADDADTHTVETHIYRLRKKILDKFSDEKFIANSKLGYSI